LASCPGFNWIGLHRLNYQGWRTGEPLYRLYNIPEQQHVWSIDLNEHDTDAAAYGWTKEGVIGYVM